MASDGAPKTASQRWAQVRSARRFVMNQTRRRIHRENFSGRLLRGDKQVEEAKIARCIHKGVSLFSAHGASFDAAHDDRRVEFTLGDGVPVTMEEFHESAFAAVRDAFGVDEREYHAILGGGAAAGGAASTPHNTPPAAETDMRLIDVGAAAGKSMAWFLVSAEQRYLLKTCDPTEAKLLLELLPSYYEHIQRSAGTLLPRYYGLYLLRRGSQATYFFCMANVFAGHFPITRRFDVKGATMGREASARERAKAAHATLKDLDLLRLGRPLVLAGGPREHQEVLDQLEADAAWLAARGLLDYSLLLGLASRPAAAPPISRHVVRALPIDDAASHCGAAGENLCYVGIVDILMRYGALKAAEHHALRWLLGDISCKPPREYAARFVAFARHVLHATPDHGYLAHHGPFERDWVSRRGVARSLGMWLGIRVEFGRKDLLAAPRAVRLALGAGALGALLAVGRSLALAHARRRRL